jgi:hypothetical protein
MKLQIRSPRRTVNMSAEGGCSQTVKKPNIALLHTYAKLHAHPHPSLSKAATWGTTLK